MKNSKRYTQEDQLMIVNEYQKGNFTVFSIAKKLKMSHATVKKALEANHIRIKPVNETTRKLKVNESYFEKIDTENKAYFLGLFYADGCNCEDRRAIRISLQEEDSYILEAFRKEIEFEGVLKVLDSKVAGRKLQKYINIASKKISEDLVKLGCMQAKTHKLKFPNTTILSPQYYSHFIRGYFDGDGSIAGDKNPQVTIISTGDFLTRLQEVLISECSLNKTKLGKRHKDRVDTILTLAYTGSKNCKKIYDFLYKDATVFLSRKKERFEKIFKSKNIHV